MKKLFILSGGVGSEREVSLSSGRNVVDTLLSQGVACEEIIVEKDKSFVYQGVTMSEKEGLDFLKKENALVFQVIHGTYGEDGELVKKLEEHALAYIGTNSTVLEKTLNKYNAEVFFKECSILTTESLLIRRGDSLLGLSTLVYPVVIKPNKEGSSIGVTKAKNIEEILDFVGKSLESFSEVLVQKCIAGREFTCGVVEIDGVAVALVPSEVVLPEGMTFDYHAKYFVNGLEITPAVTDDETTKKIQDLALRVHNVIGCKDYSRTDMMMNEVGDLVVLEINTVPGMTKVSFIPAEMKASGYLLKDFISGMIKKYS